MDNEDVVALQEKANETRGPVAKQLREENAKAAAQIRVQELSDKVPSAPERLFPFRFADTRKYGYLASMIPGDVAFIRFSELDGTDLDPEEVEIAAIQGRGFDTQITAYLTDGTIKVTVIDGALGVSDEHTLAVANGDVYPIREQIGPKYRRRHVTMIRKLEGVREELSKTKKLFNQLVKRNRRTHREMNKQEELANAASKSLKKVTESTSRKWYIGFYAGCIFSALAYWAVNNTEIINLVQKSIQP